MHYQRCELSHSPAIWVSNSDPATFYRLGQALLQDRLTDLKDLIEGENGQAESQDLRNLVVLVSGEIESWLYRGEVAMTYEAQITLSNMASNGSTKGNQFSCKVS